MAQKKIHEAAKIIHKAARMNGKQLSDEVIQALEMNLMDDHERLEKRNGLSKPNGKTPKVNNQTWLTLKQFMSSRTIIFRCAILCFVW